MNLRELSRQATAIENGSPLPTGWPEGNGLIVGITGPPGAGKSSLADALILELRARERSVAVIAVDPSSRATGGAILGDRIRMQRHHADPGVFIRSMATRGETGGLAKATTALARLFRGAGFDFVIVETVGVGQDEIQISSHADVTVVVLVPGMGDEIQAIKAGIMEIADIFVINKADRPDADRTRHELSIAHEAIPIFLTVAIDRTGVSALIDAIAARPRRTVPTSLEWELDHLGVAVRSIEEALPFYESQLGTERAVIETVEHENVRVAMIPAGAARVELLEATSPGSAIQRFIEKRGPGLHHVAMRVSDLTSVIERLQSEGVRLIGTPQRGAGGHLYVFVHPAGTGGVLWELIQA